MRYYIDGEDITAYVSLGDTMLFQKTEELDGGSFIIGNTEREEVYNPGSIFFMADGTIIRNAFVISTDNVTIAGRNPTTYKHEIQYQQLTHFFDKFVIAGKNFSQPSINPHNKAFGTSVFRGLNQSPISTNHNAVKKYDEEKIDEINLFVRPFAFTEPTLQSGNYVSHADNSLVNVSDIMFTIYGKYNGTWYAIKTLYGSSLIQTTIGYTLTIKKTDINNIDNYTEFYALATEINIYSLRYALLSVRCDLSLTTHYFTFENVVRGIFNAECLVNRDVKRPFAINDDDDFTYSLMRKTSPDFAFQQGTTMYDALVAVADSANCKLKADYYAGYIRVWFEPYIKTGSEVNEERMIDSSSSVNDKDRVNTNICSYQNAQTKNAIVSPAFGSAAYAKSNVYGIAKENSWKFIAEAPIKQVVGFSFYISSCSFDTQTSYNGHNVLIVWGGYVEVSDFVYPEEEKALLPLDLLDGDSPDPSASNVLTYTPGSKEVNVSEVFTRSDDYRFYIFRRTIACGLRRLFGSLYPYDIFDSINPSSLLMTMAYIPQMNGNIAVDGIEEKKYGNLLSSGNAKQTGSSVELSKLGKNMLSATSMSGTVQKTKMVCFGSYNDIPKVGDTYSDSEGDYVVTCVKSTQIYGGYTCALSLTKDFSKLSNRTTIDREVRQNEISKELAVVSEYIYKEEALFCDINKSLPSRNATVCSSSRFATFFNDSLFGYNSSLKITIGIAHNTDDTYGFLLGNRVYSAGNNLCIEGIFKDAKTAGFKTENSNGVYNSSPVVYTNEAGFVNNPKVFAASDFGILENNGKINISSYKVNNMKTIVSKKNPNEVLGVNYEIVFKSINDNIFVYPSMAEMLAMGASDPVTPFQCDKGLRFFYGGVYTKFGVSDYGTEQSNFQPVSHSVSDSELVAVLKTNINDSWLLTDKNKNPLIACSDSYQTAGFRCRLANTKSDEIDYLLSLTINKNMVKSITIENVGTFTDSCFVKLKTNETYNYTLIAKPAWINPETSGTISTSTSLTVAVPFGAVSFPTGTITPLDIDIQTPINQGGGNSQGNSQGQGNNPSPSGSAGGRILDPNLRELNP